jgi:Na+/H+-dicarboxylate symporter
MSLTARVLVGLVAGLVIGVIISLTQHPASLAAVSVVEPIGALWVNAIRMTVIPLVVSLLVTGVASTSARSAGSIGGRALAFFVVLVAGSALLAAVACWRLSRRRRSCHLGRLTARPLQLCGKPRLLRRWNCPHSGSGSST